MRLYAVNAVLFLVSLSTACRSLAFLQPRPMSTSSVRRNTATNDIAVGETSTPVRLEEHAVIG